MGKPILCLDFDGVVHCYSNGWKGVGIIDDAPVAGALRFILEALERFDVAIYSSRSSKLRGRWAMKRYLRRHLKELFWQDLAASADLTIWSHTKLEIPMGSYETDELATDMAAGVVKRISWPWFKPSAFITIDDRALTFDGTWPSLADIAAFKPWNKRPVAPPQHREENT